MAKNKRLQESIKKRTAEKRKHEDILLESGSFKDIGELSAEITDTSYSGTRKKRRSSWDSEEQEYELKPRKLQNEEEDMVDGLPIKIDGKVARNLVKRQKKTQDNNKENDEESFSSESDISDTEEQNIDHDDEKDENEPDTEETIVALKEEIAELVEKVMEDPEEHYASLTRLVKMAHSKNPNTCKFAMLALVPVFNSVIPGYRIRPLTELEKKEKVSKDVARLRNFEQNLVVNYKNYVGLLGKLAKIPNNSTPIKVALGNLAMNAVNTLIPNVSHFNFRSDLLAILIRRVCKPSISSDPTAIQSIKTIETLFTGDDEGTISVEVIRIFCKVVKVRNYNIEESVLNTLLSLDVLHDYDPNSKEETDNYKPMKLKKKNRIHLSKKERKARKEMKEIEEEMRKAELAVSAEERERNQAEILKAILTLYLNVLKSGNTRLIGSVLEGLSKFGNMANFDLLGDFLEVMKEIIYEAELDNLSSEEVRKVLLCIVTAFSLISNNTHMKVNIDLSKFVDALYSLLRYVALDADIELSYKSLRLADPLNIEIVKPSVNVSTKAELLLKALDHVFFRSKSGTRERASAFTKRLYMCMMHTPEKTTIALLRFIDKLMNKYPEIGGLYSTEDRITNGKFNMETDSISKSNPDAATLWENHLLSKHYCPGVINGIRALSKRSKEYSS